MKLYPFSNSWDIMATLRKLRKQRPLIYQATTATPPWWLDGWDW